MNTYVAYLRGINVGGNNIIKMADLKATFENMGFTNVKTFIQSGNVIFQSDSTNKRLLEKKIEKELSKKFKYAARVLIRSKQDMRATIKAFPKIFQDEGWKHNVIFISHVIDNKNIRNLFQINGDIEQITYAKGVLFWSAKLDKITQSKMLKVSSKPEYKEMSVRNTNTTKKIMEILNTYS